MNKEMVVRHLAVFTAIGNALITLDNKQKAARYDSMITEYKHAGKDKEQILLFYASEIQKLGHWPKDSKGEFVGYNKAASVDVTAKGFMAFRTYLNNWYDPKTLNKRVQSVSQEKSAEKADKAKEVQAIAEQKAKELSDMATPLTVSMAIEFLKSRKDTDTKKQAQINKALANLEKLMIV